MYPQLRPGEKRSQLYRQYKQKNNLDNFNSSEAQWPIGICAGPRIEWSPGSGRPREWNSSDAE